MIYQTLPGLPIRQADRKPDMNLTKLPDIIPSSGSGNALGIHIEQRLPPIRHLLSGVPSPSTKPPFRPTGFPSPLPSPIEPSPSLFTNPFSRWSTLPPRPQSSSGNYPGFLPPLHDLGPRRASAGCLYTAARSISLPSPVAAQPTYPQHHHHHHHTRMSPPRDHTRQRRTSKQATRLRRRGSSPSPSQPTLLAAQANRLNTKTRNDEAAAPRKEKRNNTPYTFEQEAFIIYHRCDLEMTWDQVRVAYMKRWPGLKRTTGGIQCGYYRTNSKLPVVTEEGLLVLVDLEVDSENESASGAGLGIQGQHQQQQHQQPQTQTQGYGSWATGQLTPATTPDLNSGISSSYPFSQAPYPTPSSSFSSSFSSSHYGSSTSSADSEPEPEPMDEEIEIEIEIDPEADSDGNHGEKNDDNTKRQDWYKFYRGVAYRTPRIPCRRGLYPLMERYPEELVDERNDWVREEHRVAAGEIAEKRRRQREEFLAAKASRQSNQRMIHS